jgi:hypothetical protein
VHAYSADTTGSSSEAGVSCAAGTKVLGGFGQIFDGGGGFEALVAIFALTDGSGVRADGEKVQATTTPWNVEVQAICGTVSS